MSPHTPPKPTEAELAILRVLWTEGPSSVRQVHDLLADERGVAYTTTLKLLQIMTEKGLVIREGSGQQHVHRARQTEEATQRRLLKDLLERAFGGSTTQLVVQALATKKASKDEIDAIRRLLAEYEEKQHE